MEQVFKAIREYREALDKLDSICLNPDTIQNRMDQQAQIRAIADKHEKMCDAFSLMYCQNPIDD